MNKFNVGDKVVVINDSNTFTTYNIWFEKNAPEYLDEYNDIKYGRSNIRCGDMGTIIKFAEYCNTKYGMLYLVQSENKICLIEEKGIKLIERDIKLEDLVSGCIIETKDDRYVYLKDINLYSGDNITICTLINLGSGGNRRLSQDEWNNKRFNSYIEDGRFTKIGYPYYMGHLITGKNTQIKTVIWEKDYPKKLSVAEIETLLGYKIEIVGGDI